MGILKFLKDVSTVRPDTEINACLEENIKQMATIRKYRNPVFIIYLVCLVAGMVIDRRTEYDYLANLFFATALGTTFVWGAAGLTVVYYTQKRTSIAIEKLDEEIRRFSDQAIDRRQAK